jgi:hypothetical protein
MDRDKILTDLTILFLFCINTGKRVKSFYSANLIFTHFKIIINPSVVTEYAFKEELIKLDSKNKIDISYGRYSLSDKGVELIKSIDINELIDRLSISFPLDKHNILDFLNITSDKDN